MAGIVPVKGESNVPFAVPVFFYLVMLFDNIDQMISVLISNIFHSKVIHDESKTFGAPIVHPKSRGVGTLPIAMGV